MGKTDVIDLMQHHGVKPTANRILVAAALCDALRPLSMAEVGDILDTVDKSVISRTLMLFRDNHLVHVIEDGSDSVRYEICHSHDDGEDDDVHVHFYCEKCRRTFCLHDIQIPSVNLPEGYSMESVNYMVKGICPECSAKG
jgi:Fur family ferric uptake transcriptional regulator